MEKIIAWLIPATVGVLIWYLKTQTKQNAKRENDAYKERTKREEKHDAIQAEERTFNRDLIIGTLSEIHKTGIKNSELSRKSIGMQKQFATETVGTLKILCDRMNGGTEGIKAIATLKAIDECKKNSKVEMDRRK